MLCDFILRSNVMRIINISDIKDDSVLQKMNYVNGIDFLDGDQCNFVVNVAANSGEEVKK